LIRRRFDVGVIPELDLRQQQSRVDAARVDIALFTRWGSGRERAGPPGRLQGAAGSPAGRPGRRGSARDIAAGTSSEVLLTRPDILGAEHLLKATGANIGAARAAFFPRISLTTAIGTASKHLSGLFDGGSEAWTLAPQIVMPSSIPAPGRRCA